MGFFTALLDPRIAIAEAPLSGAPDDLTAEEMISAAQAVPRRRLEFAMGRTCARAAMATLGYARSPLPRGQDRMPMWPDGLIGSITHTDTWAAAAVARREEGFSAVGIDLEPANGLSADLWPSICLPGEQATFAAMAGMTPGLAAHLVFCMKEAAFKCQFSVSGAMLDFADFAIDADSDAGIFSATFRKNAAPFRVGNRLIGRFAVSDGHIASAVVLTSERTP